MFKEAKLQFEKRAEMSNFHLVKLTHWVSANPSEGSMLYWQEQPPILS